MSLHFHSQNISKIGLGTYRMNSSNPEHFNALLTAFQQGYNLIDTASNYQRGMSEELIGKFFKAYPQYSKQAFVISKAGYLPHQKWISDQLEQCITNNQLQLANIEFSTPHCLEPHFINFQLEESLRKIDRPYIDCYLLHNPERYLKSSNMNQKLVVYDLIHKAFLLLEEKVKEGKIRAYGISSNHMFDPNKNTSLDFEKILNIAKSINDNPNFKFIQFPFNFKETSANQFTYHGKSLIDLAKENGIKTISNRPLNMFDNGLEFRFIKHEPKLYNQDEQTSHETILNFIRMVESELNNSALKPQPADTTYEPLEFLKSNYNRFISQDAIYAYFNRTLLPFLNLIYKNNLPNIIDNLNGIQTIMRKYALKNSSEKAINYMQTLVEKRGIQAHNNYPLTAVNYYLNHIGIDYVLMGLRKPKYILELNNHFTCK